MAEFFLEADIHGTDVTAFVGNKIRDGLLWYWVDEQGTSVAIGGYSLTAAMGDCTVTRIGPMYTIPAHRGRGYGSMLTYHFSEIIRIKSPASKAILFAVAANSISNHVYSKLGYRIVEENVEYTRKQLN